MNSIVSGTKQGSGVLLADEIFCYDGFLSKETCLEILEELEIVFWKPSLTYKRQKDKTYKNMLTPFRISETAHQAWFGDPLNLILARIEKRINDLFGVQPEYLEPWQATKYPIGGKFDYHLDAGYWGNHPAGERIFAFLIYLTTPQIGGGTHFRALDVYVEGKAGLLVAWNNLFPDGYPNHRLIHSSAPLENGEKITLVSWQRQRKFRGK
jgi:prolyl 4-hydroxylase